MMATNTTPPPLPPPPQSVVQKVDFHDEEQHHHHHHHHPNNNHDTKKEEDMSSSSSVTGQQGPPSSSPPVSKERQSLHLIQHPSNVISKPVTPLLVGKYEVQGRLVIWSGRWGMGDASFESGGVTSAFEMKSLMDDQVPLHSPFLHPAGGHAVLRRSDEKPNNNTGDNHHHHHHPVFTGYTTTTASSAVTGPSHGIFNGFFQIQAVTGKIQTVTEKQVHIRFSPDAMDDTLYHVYGMGTNKFGDFHLRGSFSSTSGEMRTYKLYQPKPLKPKTKPASKRGRFAREAKPKRIFVAKTPKSVKAESKPVEVKTPASSSSSTSMTIMSEEPLARVRSERKRVIPAHLREDEAKTTHLNGNMKKCADILKNVLSSQYAQPFSAPVDPVALNIPEYPKIITNPMDLGTVNTNLKNGVYKNPLEFAAHVRLTFSNAMLFNRPEHSIHVWAKKLSDNFEKKFKTLAKKCEAELVAEAAANAAATAAAAKANANANANAATGSDTAAESGGEKKSRKGTTKKGSTKKRRSELEMMKQQIEEMKAQIRMMHASRGSTPVGGGTTPSAQRELSGDDLNRAMTFEEKRQLSKDINKLPEAKLGRVIQIINERVPLKPGQSVDDEIEIDINSFDTPTLRTLQAYVRSVLSNKRRRTSKPKGSMSQLQRAREAGRVTSERIQTVQKELQKLTGDNTTTTVKPTKAKEPDDASSSSGSSSDSSSDSESDSSDDELNFHKSPVLASAPALSSMVVQTPSEKKEILLPRLAKDEGSTEPVKVENKGAWSLLGTQASKVQEEKEPSSSSALWSAARSQVQQIQQREEDLAAQQHRLVEARERENAAAHEALGRQKLEKEEAERRRLKEAARDAEEQRQRMRQAERLEREQQEPTVDLESQSKSASMLEAQFDSSTSSFL